MVDPNVTPDPLPQRVEADPVITGSVRPDDGEALNAAAAEAQQGRDALNRAIRERRQAKGEGAAASKGAGSPGVLGFNVMDKGDSLTVKKVAHRFILGAIPGISPYSKDQLDTILKSAVEGKKWQTIHVQDPTDGYPHWELSNLLQKRINAIKSGTAPDGEAFLTSLSPEAQARFEKLTVSTAKVKPWTPAEEPGFGRPAEVRGDAQAAAPTASAPPNGGLDRVEPVGGAFAQAAQGALASAGPAAAPAPAPAGSRARIEAAVHAG